MVEAVAGVALKKGGSQKEFLKGFLFLDGKQLRWPLDARDT